MVDPIKPVVREVRETSRIWVILSLVLFATTLGGAVIIIAFGIPFESPDPTVAMLKDLAQMEAELEKLEEEAMMEDGDAPNGFYDASPDYTFEYPSSVEVFEGGGPSSFTLTFLRFLPEVKGGIYTGTGVSMETARILDSTVDGADTFDGLVGYWSSIETVGAGGEPGLYGIETGTLDGASYLKLMQSVPTNTDTFRQATIYIDRGSTGVMKIVSNIDPVEPVTLTTILETIDFNPEPEDVEEAE